MSFAYGRSAGGASPKMEHRTPCQGIELIAVAETSVQKVLSQVVACERCCTSASRFFGSVMNEVLVGGSGNVVEYVLSFPAACPKCGNRIIENTLVGCANDGEPEPDVLMEFELCWEDTSVVLIS